MKNIKMITRADDAGSSRSANAAILRAVRAGFIKNVSLMAVGNYINEAASMFGKTAAVCFGIHTTLNAEWDRVKWGPITRISKDSGLIDDNGFFLSYPSMFMETRPLAEMAIREYDAQLDRLAVLGFDVKYVDSHMYEERFIEGLSDMKREWARRKGLLYHMDYENIPSGINEESSLRELVRFIGDLPDGQYLMITHPALYGEDMLMTGNSGISGEDIARMRNLEADVVTDGDMIRSLRAEGIKTIRYDEALAADYHADTGTKK